MLITARAAAPRNTIAGSSSAGGGGVAAGVAAGGELEAAGAPPVAVAGGPGGVTVVRAIGAAGVDPFVAGSVGAAGPAPTDGLGVDAVSCPASEALAPGDAPASAPLSETAAAGPGVRRASLFGLEGV